MKWELDLLEKDGGDAKPSNAGIPMAAVAMSDVEWAKVAACGERGKADTLRKNRLWAALSLSRPPPLSLTAARNGRVTGPSK